MLGCSAIRMVIFNCFKCVCIGFSIFFLLCNTIYSSNKIIC
jgi:hypothetical protein